MLDIICLKCGNKLNEPGGLLFSPPKYIDSIQVNKTHLCIKCYKTIIDWVVDDGKELDK